MKAECMTLRRQLNSNAVINSSSKSLIFALPVRPEVAEATQRVLAETPRTALTLLAFEAENSPVE